MKWSDIQPKSKEQLFRDITASRGRMVDLRFKAQSGTLKQVHQISDAKKELSRLLTRMHQLEHTDTSAKDAAQSEAVSQEQKK